jgi:parvulin-like peptidyl-prolyl isomerase
MLRFTRRSAKCITNFVLTTYSRPEIVPRAWTKVSPVHRHGGRFLHRGGTMRFLSKIAVLGTALSSAMALAQVASHAPTMPVTTASNTTVPASPAPVSSMEVTGKPVVRVNGSILTDRDLLREMFAMFPYARQHNGFPKGKEGEIRKGAMQMIEYEELVYQEAERRKMTIPAARLNQAEGEYRSKFQSEEEFNEYLKAEMNGSRELLRKQIRRSLLIEALLKIEVTDKSKVSLAEARAYYDKNPKLFHHGELFAFQTISIMPPETASPEEKQRAKQRAEDALKQAKATKSFQDFGLLAEKISEDDYRVNMGDHKLVKREDLPPEIAKPATAMQLGQVSNLIQIGSFYFFFRLNAHVPAGKVAFEEVKDRLLSDLHKTKYDRLRADLDKRLRLHAKVEEV